MTINKLANRIEELRKEHELTQTQLAEMLNLSEPKTRGRSTVNNWEQGTPIKSDMIEKICKTFDVSPSWLFGATDCKSTNEDMQIAHKTTGLNEKSIKNLKKCDPLIINRIIGNERFVALIDDICSLESALSGVEEVEEETARIVPAEDLNTPIRTIWENRHLVKRPDGKISIESSVNPVEVFPFEWYEWSERVSHLKNLYQVARVEKYDLAEAFSNLIEEVVPSRTILETAKKTLKERGEGFSQSAEMKGKEE